MLLSSNDTLKKRKFSGWFCRGQSSQSFHFGMKTKSGQTANASRRRKMRRQRERQQ